MIKFKEFFYKTLLETPMNSGVFDSEYSDTQIAQQKYADIMMDDNIRCVHTLYPDTYPVYLYEEREGNDIMLSFVPEHDNFIYGYATYEETSDGGAVMGSVYNRPTYVGLAQGVYNRYLIPKYLYIMSDGRHSAKGRNFWRNIVTANLDKNISVWDISTNSSVIHIENIKQLDKFYGDDVNYERFRLKISK